MSQQTFSSTLIFLVVAFLTLTVKEVFSKPIFGIDRNIKSDLVLVNKLHSARNNGGRNHINPSDIPIGEALDLFYRYGFFSLSVRVVPRDDAGSWLIREPTASIFEKNSLGTQVIPEKNSFEDNFQVFFCDDQTELMEAYFRDFTADAVEQPHKLYTGSWHSSTKSKYFGLSKESFDGDSSFILVKLPKKTVTYKTGNRMALKSGPGKSARSIQQGNPESAMKFIRSYGSHYIQSVTVGEVVYQVFALNKDQYEVAKMNMGNLNARNLQTFHKDHLAPWLVRDTGKIQAASGDRSLKQFLESSLVDQGQFGSYSNIFKLQEDPALMQTLEDLAQDTSAVVGLHFGSMNQWIPDIQTREYYNGLVDTQSSLWGANI